MLRRTVFVLAVVLAGAVAVPAWAAHSTPVGKNCPDFTYQEDAQEYFNTHPGDPEGLDDDDDGVACKNLPRRPSGGGGPTPTTTTTVASGTGIISITPAPAPVIARGFLERTG